MLNLLQFFNGGFNFVGEMCFCDVSCFSDRYYLRTICLLVLIEYNCVMFSKDSSTLLCLFVIMMQLYNLIDALIQGCAIS